MAGFSNMSLMAALLTSTSRWPKRARAASRRAAIESGSVTSRASPSEGAGRVVANSAGFGIEVGQGRIW